jgi:dihydrofolate synthase/folylpolyglutamate synthase
MDKLGNSLGQIAGEKCGIIKSRSICVSAPQQDEALKVIEKTCEERGSRLILVGKDIIFEEIRSDDREEVFNVSSESDKYPVLKSHLLGSHQMLNAATAIGVIEGLRSRGITIPMDAVRKGIEDARWDGRLEVINKHPYIILDGAQNKASAGCLANAIKKIFKYRKLILVLGISKDKDIQGILEELIPISDSVVLTKSKVVERAMEPVRIKELIKEVPPVVSLTSNVEDALKKAQAFADKKDLILVTGSLFVVGEAKCIKAH